MDCHAVMLIQALVCLMAPIETLYPLSVCCCCSTPPLALPFHQHNSRFVSIHCFHSMQFLLTWYRELWKWLIQDNFWLVVLENQSQWHPVFEAFQNSKCFIGISLNHIVKSNPGTFIMGTTAQPESLTNTTFPWKYIINKAQHKIQGWNWASHYKIVFLSLL